MTGGMTITGITLRRMILAPDALAIGTARSNARSDAPEPSCGTRIVLYVIVIILVALSPLLIAPLMHQHHGARLKCRYLSCHTSQRPDPAGFQASASHDNNVAF